MPYEIKSYEESFIKKQVEIGNEVTRDWIGYNMASAENIIVAMMHTNKKGESKLLKKCTLPLTGVNCVKKIVTNLAILDVIPEGFKLLERAPDVSVEEIQNATEGRLVIEGDIPEMRLD